VSDWLTEANRRLGDEEKAERLVVYVAGPYSATNRFDRELNVRHAIRAGQELMMCGHVVLIPHLSHFVDRAAIEDGLWRFSWAQWMEQSLALLERCDALLFLGHSPGADREWMHAKMLQIPALCVH
jgi:hypothetical protein